MFKKSLRKQKKEENIIILILRELGINVVKLLAREQLYRQKKLPRGVSEIIESNLVENVRFVNALKRNIFTEKELSEKLRKWIKIFLDLKSEIILESREKEIEKLMRSDFYGQKERKMDRKWLKGKIEIENEIEKGNLIYLMTLELEAKERAENIQKLEKEELEAVRKELIELSQTLTTKEKTINNEISENVVLRTQKAENSKKINQLEKEKNDWKEKYEKQRQQKRISLIANVAQGAIEWLPIPEKWQGGLKTSIQAVSMWALFKDLPNWTYEGFIMVTGIGLWYALLHILRKINRVIFGKKEKKQISNLEQALTNIFEKGAMGKKSEPEQKELNQPVAISKEPVNNGEISTQISSEKTDPIIEEKKEKEKPTKEGKNGKKAKKKKKNQ